MNRTSRRARHAVPTLPLAVAAGACALALLATAQGALAANTIVNEPFGSGWTPGTQWAVSGNYSPSIVNIGGQTPVDALRLTPASPTIQRSTVTYTTPQPAIGGLDVRFKVSQWGGNVPGTPANGMSFFLRQGSNASNDASAWTGGAGLGYVGLPGGLVGVGLDAYGGFPWVGTNGTGCSTGTPNANDAPDSIAVRGPGQPGVGDVQGSGYCLIAGTPNPWVTGSINFGGSDRSNGARAIRVTVDPSTVANPQVKVFYAATAGGTPTEVLSRPVPPELLAESTIKFGFAGATGAATQNNELWDVQVSSLVDLPAMAITTTSMPNGTVGAAYACTTVAQVNGVAPVTFGIASGALPPGLTLDGATGAVCGTPSKSGTYAFTISATDSRGPVPSATGQAYTVGIADSAPPCTPVNLTSKAGVESATVSWNPDTSDGCAGITSYEVDSSDEHGCAVTAPDTSCTITGLPAGVSVRFRVRARNAIGASPWTEYGARAVPEARPATTTPAASGAEVVTAGQPTTSLSAVVVPVTTTRAGTITLIGSSREHGRWVTRCVGRARAAQAGTRQVACALTPVARRVLCTRPLRLRLLSRIATPGMVLQSSTRSVWLARRTCVAQVTG